MNSRVMDFCTGDNRIMWSFAQVVTLALGLTGGRHWCKIIDPIADHCQSVQSNLIYFASPSGSASQPSSVMNTQYSTYVMKYIYHELNYWSRESEVSQEFDLWFRKHVMLECYVSCFGCYVRVMIECYVSWLNVTLHSWMLGVMHESNVSYLNVITCHAWMLRQD